MLATVNYSADRGHGKLSRVLPAATQVGGGGYRRLLWWSTPAMLFLLPIMPTDCYRRA